MNTKAILALFLMHFTGDFYQSFFMPLLPVLKANFGLSLTQVGLITSVMTLASFVTQPITGHLADRFNPRAFLYAGMVLSMVFIPLLGVTPWFGGILALVAFGAFGSSLYHPAAAGLVSVHAPARPSTAMSLFGLGGTLAHAIGPLAVTAYVGWMGLSRLPWLSLVGVTLLIVLIMLVPRSREPQAQGRTHNGSLLAGFSKIFKPILALWLICTLRSLVDISLKSFYPILHVERGNSLVSMGLVLTMFMLGGSLSALAAGHFADTRGYRRLFVYSFALATPCLLLFMRASGFWVYPTAFLAGFVLLASMFPAVALASKIAPENKTLAASLALGFASGTGGLMAPLVGSLSETYGVQTVLTGLAFAPLFCVALVPLLPGLKKEK
jgi:FSR family fosmidomycin resistance protein-like MFS transporter